MGRSSFGLSTVKSAASILLSAGDETDLFDTLRHFRNMDWHKYLGFIQGATIVIALLTIWSYRATYGGIAGENKVCWDYHLNCSGPNITCPINPGETPLRYGTSRTCWTVEEYFTAKEVVDNDPVARNAIWAIYLPAWVPALGMLGQGIWHAVVSHKHEHKGHGWKGKLKYGLMVFVHLLMSASTFIAILILILKEHYETHVPDIEYWGVSLIFTAPLGAGLLYLFYGIFVPNHVANAVRDSLKSRGTTVTWSPLNKAADASNV